jgi:hypothetical protein
MVSALTGAWSRDRTTEFSGTWDLSALVAKDADGNFLPIAQTTGSELAGTNAGIALNDKLLLGVIQHGGESGGQAFAMMSDNGGQLMILQLALPIEPVTAAPTIAATDAPTVATDAPTAAAAATTAPPSPVEDDSSSSLLALGLLLVQLTA